jgi:hypothetical protein
MNMTSSTSSLYEALLGRAYDQAMCEYGDWLRYEKEQWLSLLTYGRDDLLDLTFALLSNEKRVKYPIAALDLAALTLTKFKLDGVVAAQPVRHYVANTRTNNNDPCQYFTLNVRFGVTVDDRLHFGPHLLARCAILSRQTVEDYFRSVSAQGTVAQELLPAVQRELGQLLSNACPYEQEAARLCRPDRDGIRRAGEFLNEQRLPPVELQKANEGDAALLEMLAKMIREAPKDEED